VIGFPQAGAQPADWPRRRIAPVFGMGGMVAGGHPLAAQTGLDILKSGGNAVDAAVGAGLVAAVVMPEMCGLGGDLFAVLHDPASGRTVSVQGSGIVSRRATLDQMRRAADTAGPALRGRGPLSVSVPGMVHGYFTLLESFGSKSFAELVAPAIQYAEGYPISPVGVSYIDKFAELLTAFPSSAKVFLPDGAPPAPGSIFRQAGLAHTLRLLADGGPDVFYAGEIAERIEAALAELGGALAVDDLREHRTDVTAPISTTYRDYTVYQTRLPSQGLIVLEALNIAENFDLPAMRLGSPQAIHTLVEATRLAFADRIGHCMDPAFGESPVDELISKEWAEKRSREIGSTANPTIQQGELAPGDTSYLCAVDGSGMMVSLIQSVAANFGSGIVAGDTGVVLNNRASQLSLTDGHPNRFEPGKKTVHTLNCYLVADPDGTPVLVGGTPGGDRQPLWNVQVITGLVDAGWDAQQAIEQPMWFGAREADGGFRMSLEGRAGEATHRALVERGHQVELIADWGCESVAQVIARDPETGALAGGTDPRGEGLVLGY
jgi:gamma-glutamyltranspeptidase